MTAETHGSVPNALGEGALDSRLADLVRSLTHARRRSNLRTFFEGLVTSIAIALALFIVLELLHALLGGLAPVLSFEWISLPAWFADWRPAPVPQHIVVALIGGIAAFIVAQFTAASRRPGISRMARAADRRFGMEERLSTALELARSPDRSPGVIREALLQDAARRAASVDARELMPIGLRWQALAVPVLAVIAVLIVITPPAPILADVVTNRTSTAAVTTAAAAFTPEERLETAEELRAIAAILAQDGQARNDAVLQAVAAELNALAETVETDAGLTRTATGNALAELADITANVYEGAGLTTEDIGYYATLLDDALRAIDPGRYQTTETARPADPGLPTGIPDGIGVAGANVPLGEDGTVTLPPGAQLAPNTTLEVVEGAAVPPELDHGWDDPYAEGDVAEGPLAVNPEVEIIGVGNGAGGNLAGAGTPGTLGDALLDAPINPAATLGEMVLTDTDPGNGRLVTMDLPPMEALVGAAGAEGLTPGIWAFLAEQQVNRAAVPAADREVYARYWQTIQQNKAEPAE